MAHKLQEFLSLGTIGWNYRSVHDWSFIFIHLWEEIYVYFPLYKHASAFCDSNNVCPLRKMSNLTMSALFSLESCCDKSLSACAANLKNWLTTSSALDVQKASNQPRMQTSSSTVRLPVWCLKLPRRGFQYVIFSKKFLTRVEDSILIHKFSNLLAII